MLAQMQNMTALRVHLTVINMLEFLLVNLSYCDINQNRELLRMRTMANAEWQFRVNTLTNIHLHKYKIWNNQHLHICFANRRDSFA